MKRKAIQKLTGLLTAACMLFAQTLSSSSILAAGTLPEKATDDLADTQMIEIESSELAESPIPIYGASSAVSADKTTYEEDCYASYAGYHALDSDQQKIYNKLKEAAHTFYTGTDDAQSITYSGGSMAYFAAASNSSSALTAEDIAEVVSMFRSDNPIYFFVGSYMLYSTTTSFSGTTYINKVYVSCMEEYTDGTVRQEERAVLENTISAVQDSMTDCTTALEYATAAHDWISDTITYAYDESGNPEESMTAHSIIGVFDPAYDRAVCEGYAKAFQLLLNAVGVENYYVVGLGNGGGHAWNMARMDDGFFYYFDVTWDDSAKTNAYFAAGETSFSKEHTAFTIDQTSWQFLYDLPDVPENAYTGAVGTVYTEGDFVYALFDTYAAVTEYTGSAESVLVPETVNGLPVTQIKGAFAEHSNLQEVQLPSSVTVISYGAQGVGAFENCASLKYLTISSQLERVEWNAFAACTALEVVTLPASASQIGARAFYGCYSLRQLLIYAPACKLVSSSSVYTDTIIYGYTDSTAKSYAEKYSRNFLELEAAATETTDTSVTSETTVSDISSSTSSSTSLSTSSSSTTTSAVTTATQSVTTTTTASTTPTTTTTTASTTPTTMTTTTASTTPTTMTTTTAATLTTTTTTTATTIAVTTTMSPSATTIATTTTVTMQQSTQSMTTAASVVSVLTTTEKTVPSVVPDSVEETDTTTESQPVLPVLAADINQDGNCAINDLVFLNLYLVQDMEVSPSQLAAMDCYHDGIVDAKDSTVLLKFLVRLITELPVEPEITVNA
ncbi:leucine-rich repeat protein [uncultured Ruminococcus sp.]|mgnify:CR=1 FL=1|uniref:leucine-rich repeat protein n=1 Tax=uncultured Ruminococcus sp. TaxID=165186 RepID=UPI002620FB31|nr:leucine-rich repeat protein [uncultured Ruminococcus sp.]